MRALIAANERAMGGNIVDLRGIAMDRLEDTHRSVIAAAYENLAGTNQVHRAILRMLDPVEFESFLRDLGGDVAERKRTAGHADDRQDQNVEKRWQRAFSSFSCVTR